MPAYRPVLLRWLTSLLLLVGMFFGATPGRTQVPSVLEEMTLITQDAGQASFLLRFSPAEPQYAAVNGNPRRPELLMRTTLRAPRVPQQRTSNSLVRQISFDNSNGDLLLRFDTSEPSRVKAEPAGNRPVQVTLSRISQEEATGSRPLGSSGETVALPAYAQGAPGAGYNDYVSGDAYEARHVP